MPKRGLSSYLFYAASVRDQVRKKNPDSKIGVSLLSDVYLMRTEFAAVTVCTQDLGKIMGDQWKTMAESKKAKLCVASLVLAVLMSASDSCCSPMLQYQHGGEGQSAVRSQAFHRRSAHAHQI